MCFAIIAPPGFIGVQYGAVLGLLGDVVVPRAEYYRQKLACIRDNPQLGHMADEVLEKFHLDSFEQAEKHRTVIIPVNITYFPIRAHRHMIAKLVKGLARNLSERAMEELVVESSVFSKDSDIDIQLGEPIDIRTYLEAPELKDGDTTLLQAGMTFAVDGGISVNGKCGGRIGDSVVVTEGGCDYLTDYPRELLVV